MCNRAIKNLSVKDPTPCQNLSPVTSQILKSPMSICLLFHKSLKTGFRIAMAPTKQ